MKILFIAGWFPYKNDYSGIFVKEHAIAISKFHQITIIHGRKDRKLRCNFAVENVEEDGLNIIRFFFKKSKLSSSSFSVYVKHVLKIFDSLFKKGYRPDLIHAHIYFTAFPAYLIKRKYSIPFVITEHLSVNIHPFKKSELKRTKISFESAEYILPVCKILEKTLKNYGIENRYFTIPNAVNPENFFYKKKDKKNKTKEILAVASFHPVKGIEYLLEACKSLVSKRKDFHLTIIGDGEKFSEYKSFIERENLTNYISLLGRKTKKEIAEIMRNSDFFVLPSLWENLPCVLLESFSSGLPVVTTKTGGIPEIVNENNGILVKPASSESLEEGINWMLDNFSKFSGEKISEWAYNNFSHEAVGKKINSIYEKVINERRKSLI